MGLQVRLVLPVQMVLLGPMESMERKALPELTGRMAKMD